jgi:hypothetical protein
MTSQYNVVIFIFKSKCPDRVVEWLPYRRLSFNVNNRKRKPKGKSRMDNPEAQKTLGTRQRTKANKTKNPT